MSNEWEFFQIEPNTVGSDWAVGAGAQQNRSPNTKMSNFGALNYGGRFSFDYTRTDFEFEEKGELEGADRMGMHSLTQDAEKNENPLVVNSTVKYERDDQFTRLGMSIGGRGTGDTDPDAPGFDVSDTNVSRGPWTAGKKYPTEGWYSFGQKYDKHRAYDGTLR